MCFFFLKFAEVFYYFLLLKILICDNTWAGPDSIYKVLLKSRDATVEHSKLSQIYVH